MEVIGKSASSPSSQKQMSLGGLVFNISPLSLADYFLKYVKIELKEK